MNPDQITAIKCAYADLVGAWQSAMTDNQVFNSSHDWDSHLQSIEDLERAFTDIIEPIEIRRLYD